MSRIGKRKLQIPTGVEASLNGSVFTAKSGKGTLELNIDPLVTVTITDGVIETTPVNESPRANVIVGTMNSLIENMLIGVSDGYTKGLEIVGVGYRFNVSGNKIGIHAGFSHPVEMVCPEGISVKSISNTEIELDLLSNLIHREARIGQFRQQIVTPSQSVTQLLGDISAGVIQLISIDTQHTIIR